jgi:predicted small metal-binding protein
VEPAAVKSFACGEIVPDCPAVFTGRGYEDLLRQVADHAREVHGLLSVPPEVTAAVRAAVRDPAEGSVQRSMQDDALA